MQNRFGLLDTDVMPIFMIIALDTVITLCFSINCSAVICSPTVIFSILREASSEPMAPGSILQHISFPSTCQFWLSFPYFAIFYFSSHKPKILLNHFSISIRSHFANNREGIDNPFITLVAWSLIVCAGIL